MKRLRFCALLIIFSILLSGCYDSNEPNDLVYAVALGIDKGEGENYNITIQYARVFEIYSGSEGGESGSKILDNMVVEAPTIYAAMVSANHILSKEFILSHLELIVFSEEVAKEGIATLVEAMSQSEEIRPYVHVAITVDSAQQYLESVKPGIEINPIEFYRLLYENKHIARIPSTYIKDLYTTINSKTKDSVVPMASVLGDGDDKSKEEDSQNNGDTKSQESQNESEKSTESNMFINYVPSREQGFEYLVKDYSAGEIERDLEKPSEVMGMAIMSNDMMVGKVGGVQAELYNLISGNFKQGYITYFNRYSGRAITVKIEQNKKPDIKLKFENDIPQVYIDLSLEAELTNMPSRRMTSEDITEFENEMNEYTTNAAVEFLNRTTKEFNADILGLGLMAQRKFLTFNDFNDYKWEEKYKNSVFHVETKVRVKRSGLIVSTREVK